MLQVCFGHKDIYVYMHLGVVCLIPVE